ncbi:agmatinase [Sphingomonas changnyeongensis]|uniref:Agmatinase n=1 Tax=Sphingomonas changnyeongensis TaxID=2698679 RepID=A0A7Z2S7Q3_9SPHN|nr:agmatinase family protein [Sphingomonas changnyeongensis]QHL89862.1 agmatinase [Sphingomonas changnyeongensis]
MRPVRLIGLPTDINSSFLRGAAAAPPLIRAALLSDMGNPAAECGLELGRDIPFEDLGDLPLTEDCAADDARIVAAVRDACAGGGVPICLGGDHAVTYPVLRGIAAVHGLVAILHIDAHSDCYDELGGNRRSHASPFARIMEDGLATRLVQVGIRTLNAHQAAQVARFGIEVVPMRDFTPAGVPVPAGPLYLSVDLDGLDPAFAPGVAHHEPGGLSTRQLLDLIARIPGPLVGADIVELNPARDLNGMTATVAAKLVKEIAALAQRTG